MKTWFITGISRGLGRSLAQAALSRGDRVVGTIRDQALDLHAAPEQLLVLKLDMTEAATITPAVQQAFDWAGRVDIIVNNAGVASAKIQICNMRPVIRGIHSDQNPCIRGFAQERVEIIPRLLLEVFLHGIFQVNDDSIGSGGNSF